MQETEKEYSYKALAKEWGLSVEQVQNKAAQKKIPRHRNSHGKMMLFQADAEKLKKCFAKFGAVAGRKTKEPFIFWRLSVFSEAYGAYIVKKCSMTKEEALWEKLKCEIDGLIVIIRPCA